MGLQAPICSGASEVSLRSCKGSAGADLQALPAALPGAKPSGKGLLIMKGKILAITAKKETKIECFFLTRDCSYSRTEVTHGVSQQHVVHRSVYDHCVNQASPPGLQTALAKTNRFSLAWGLTLLKPRLGANRHKCLPPPLPPRSCCRPARSRGAARGSGGGGGSGDGSGSAGQRRWWRQHGAAPGSTGSGSLLCLRGKAPGIGYPSPG